MLLIISTFYGVTIFTTRLTQCASMIRDVAAGVLIVKEAGGLVYDPFGKDFDITVPQVAASNPFLKDAFLEALQH